MNIGVFIHPGWRERCTVTVEPSVPWLTLHNNAQTTKKFSNSVCLAVRSWKAHLSAIQRCAMFFFSSNGHNDITSYGTLDLGFLSGLSIKYLPFTYLFTQL